MCLTVLAFQPVHLGHGVEARSLIDTVQLGLPSSQAENRFLQGKWEPSWKNRLPGGILDHFCFETLTEISDLIVDWK